MREKEIVQFIPNVKELRKHMQPLYVLADYLACEEAYVDLKEQLYRLMKGCFEIKECREAPVRFKFYAKDKKTYQIQFRHFIIELFLLYPLTKIPDLDGILDDSFIPDFYTDIPKINNFINHKLIDTMRDNNVKTTVMNSSISQVTYDLKRIDMDFSLIIGLNFSTETFIDLYKNYPHIKEIMETKFEPNMQPKEIEEFMEAKQKDLIASIKAVPDNNLAIVLRSGTGIKHKQLSEFMIAQAQKPDIEGKVIPVAIENSTLIGGSDRPSYVYVDATAARKSLVLNKKVMGKAGYYGKKVLLLAETLKLSKNVFDCGTKHLVPYYVHSKSVLEKLNDKYYRTSKNPAESLKILNAKKDTHLIGSTIYVRSVATCALGDEICHCCVGRTAILNLDIADGFAGFESEEITKVISQNILSAKHLLTTDSEKIEFNDDFWKFFQLSVDEIHPYINDNPYIGNSEEWAMYVNPENIQKTDDFDSDTDYSTYIEDGSFEMVNLKTNQRIPIAPKEEKELYITPEANEILSRRKGYIFFRDIDEDFKIFNIIVNNNELTKPLYDIMDLTGKQKKKGEEETIESMCQKMMDLCIKSNIKASAVASECIVNRLIRAVNDDGTDSYYRPDFLSERLQPYKICTVDNALEHNASPYVGFAAQDLKRQLLSFELVEQKDEAGYLAPLFNPTVEYHANGIY